jgi:PAS domain S-box-containing protein
MEFEVVTVLLLLLVVALNLTIGVYVLQRNPRRAANRAFAFMASTTALWGVGVAITRYGPSHLAGAQFSWAAGILISVATLNFVENFPLPSRPGFKLWASALLSVPLIIVAWTPLVVADLTVGPHELRISYGPLQPLVSFCVIGFFLLALGTLFVKYRTAQATLRLQLKYLLVALSIPIIIGVVANVIVPTATGDSGSAKFGPLFSVVMVVIVAHAIVRHRLMDVRVVIRRGVVYLAAVVAAGVLLLALLVASSELIPDEHQASQREIVLALLVAVLFHPLKVAVQRAFDRYLYRKPYDYQREVRQTSRALTRTIDLPLLLEHIGNTLDRTVQPEWHAVFLLEEEDGPGFACVKMSGRTSIPERFTFDMSASDGAGAERRPIFRDENTSANSPVPVPLGALDAEVVVPLSAETRVIGFLAVGSKQSGDPYFSGDADLLATLADQSSVAIRNAQTHQQIREANEYINWILATIENGVISLNARGRVRLLNRAAEVMVGATAESLRGTPVSHLPAPLAHLLASSLEDGQCHTQAEFTLPDASGQLIPLMCSTSPLLGPQGALVGAVAVVSDLSRLKELEKEKRRAEHLAAIEAIAAGLAHEIQNPLVALKTFTQLLPTRGEDRAFRESTASISDREITRIENLVQRFRTLAAAATQPMDPVDVTAPLQATLDLLGPQMEERRIRLRYVADGTPRAILGNASQLEQLFLNLCLNAVEAMEPGGELTVRVADLCAAGGATLLVEVCDTGTGIAEDMLPTIFNPFVTSKARGSGLGLAICRSIADAHRATLSARNNTGRPGSTFTIEFPVPTGSATSVPT